MITRRARKARMDRAGLFRMEVVDNTPAQPTDRLARLQALIRTVEHNPADERVWLKEAGCLTDSPREAEARRVASLLGALPEGDSLRHLADDCWLIRNLMLDVNVMPSRQHVLRLAVRPVMRREAEDDDPVRGIAHGLQQAIDE